MSNVHYLSKKDALHFIANLMNEEEVVGEVGVCLFQKFSVILFSCTED